MTKRLLLCIAGAWLSVATWSQAKTDYVVSPLIAAELKGFVFYADGETPAAEVPVRVWDVNQRKFIYETTTDDFGAYFLPRLEPGRYFLTFDWLKLELEVLGNEATLIQQPHDVIVIIPRGLASVSINQMTSLLIATTLSQAAMGFSKEKPGTPPGPPPPIPPRPPVVSP